MVNNLATSASCLLVLCLLWLYSSRQERSAIGPISVVVAIWMFAAGIPFFFFLALGTEVNIYHEAYELVLLFALAACLPLVLLGRCKEHSGDERRLNPGQWQILIRILKLFSALGFLLPLVVGGLALREVGFSNILSLPLFVAASRYSQSWSPPGWISLLRMVVYATAAIGGFVFADKHSRGRLSYLCFLWIIPAILSYYVEAVRLALLCPTAFWIASFCCGTSYCRTARDFTPKRIFGWGLGAFMAAVMVLHFGTCIRAGRFDFEFQKSLYMKTATTAFGNMIVLGEWARQTSEYGYSPPEGIVSLSGIANFFGGEQRDQGLYTESVQFDVDSEGELASNIYTAIRILIDDFGIIGFIVMTSFASLLAIIAYRMLLAGHILGYPLALAYFVFGLHSVATNIYVYNSTIAAVVLSCVVVCYSVYKYENTTSVQGAALSE